MSNNTNNGNSRKPDMIAYTVTKSKGGDDYWTNIGGAWEHKEGGGYTVKLRAIPVNGEIVLMPPKEKDGE